MYVFNLNNYVLSECIVHFMFACCLFSFLAGEWLFAKHKYVTEKGGG